MLATVDKLGDRIERNCISGGYQMIEIQRTKIILLGVCMAFAATSTSARAQTGTEPPIVPPVGIFGYYLDFGAGAVWSGSDRDLESFNQAVSFAPQFTGKVGAGIVVKPDTGPFLIDLGLDGYYDELSPGRVVNKLAPGSLDVDGFSRALSIAPRIGLAGDIVPGTQWHVGAGGGIAFQSLELRTAGGPMVLSGSATTLMGHVDVGLRHEIAPCVYLGVEGFANFYDGYDVRTSTNVVSRLEPTVHTGVRATLRFVLPRLTPVTDDSLPRLEAVTDNSAFVTCP